MTHYRPETKAAVLDGLNERRLDDLMAFLAEDAGLHSQLDLRPYCTGICNRTDVFVVWLEVCV